MSYDPYNDPRLTLESIARHTADTLVDTIIREAKSATDVPAVIERIVGYMRHQWAQEEWELYRRNFGNDFPGDDFGD